MKFSALILFLYFFFNSCTIEKRHYTGGFNVHWLNSKPNSHSSSFIPNPVTHFLTAKNNPAAREQQPSQSCIVSGLQEKKSFKKKSHRKIVTALVIITPDTNEYVRKDRSYKWKFSLEEKRVLNGWALAGFICSVLFWGLSGAISGSLFLAYIWLTLPIFAIVFSIIGLVQISNSPYKYSGRGFATTGLILGCLDLLLLYYLIILLTGI